MNRYATMAREHWRRHLPDRYRQIQDPQTFFAQLGEQIQLEVIARSRALAGDDPGGETYLQKLGRLNAAQLAAEEQVIREMLPEPAEPTAT